MPKRVFFIRHGQSINNVSKDRTIKDPVLTDLGRQQALECGEHFKNLYPKPDLIITSTLERALETASLAFAHHIQDTELAVPFIAVEECREALDHISHLRGSIKEKSSRFPHVDFSGIVHDDDPYEDKSNQLIAAGKDIPFTRRFPTIVDTMERAHAFLDMLASRPEENIAVVCHGAFIAMSAAVVLGLSKHVALRLIKIPGNGEVMTIQLLEEDEPHAAAHHVDPSSVDPSMVYMHVKPSHRWTMNVSQTMKVTSPMGSGPVMPKEEIGEYGM